MTNRKLVRWIKQRFDELDSESLAEFLANVEKMFGWNYNLGVEAATKAIWEERHTFAPITHRAIDIGRTNKQSPYSRRISSILDIPRSTLYNKLKREKLI